MFRSLRSRLLFTHLLVSTLVLFIVAVGVLLFLSNSRVLERQTISRLNGAVELVAQRGPRGLQQLGAERLGRAFQSLGVPNARGLIVGPGGEVLADTRPGAERPPRDLLEQAASSESPIQGRYGGLLDRWLYAAQPTGEGRALLLVTPRPSPVAILGQELLLPLLLQAGAVALAASLLLAWLISRWVSAPIQRTARAARSVAAGDYGQRLAPSGPEEAHSLATSFNEMVQQVQGSQQAMRDFVANVSHELRTPLTSIQGYAQAITDGTAKDTQHAATVIHEEADRLARLVEELLDLARLDAGQTPLAHGPVDLNGIVTSIVEKLNIRAQAKGVTIVNKTDRLPTIIGDGDRLAQVFTNLLDNALKHTPDGGEVRLKSQQDPGWTTVHIDDTGGGIPADELSRIFERFYQLDKARSGSGPRGAGLGLAISKEIVEAHGGTLSAQSVVGRGSRFTVRLPVVRPDDETLASRS